MSGNRGEIQGIALMGKYNSSRSVFYKQFPLIASVFFSRNNAKSVQNNDVIKL